MPEDVNDQVAETAEAEEPELVHDDIVKRLLDYQRQLREGLQDTEMAPSSVATQTATDELVDLTGGDTLEEDFVDLTEDVSGAPRPAGDMAIDDGAVASPPPPPVGDAAADTPTSTAGEAGADGRPQDGVLPDVRSDATNAEVIVLHPDATPATMDPDATTTADDVTSTSTIISSDASGHAGAWPGTAPTSLSAPIAETTPSITGDTSDDEAADRIVQLERRLEVLSTRFAELRSSFQDMAIAADERLAEIEDLLAGTRADDPR
jgi:hypothetical protein